MTSEQDYRSFHPIAVASDLRNIV